MSEPETFCTALAGDVFIYRIFGERPIVFDINKKGQLMECKYKANKYLSKNDQKELLNYIKTRMSI